VIIVNTNVLSQVIRPDGDLRVVRWIDDHLTQLYLPTLSVSELLFGGHSLRDPVQRKTMLARMDVLLTRFGGRFLAFDMAAARIHARVAGDCRRGGHTLTPVDGRIAAIAIEREFPVATRNVKDFAPTGVRVINPGEARRTAALPPGQASPILAATRMTAPRGRSPIRPGVS